MGLNLGLRVGLPTIRIRVRCQLEVRWEFTLTHIKNTSWDSNRDCSYPK